MGPFKLPANEFIHLSLFALRSKAKVSNQVNLVEELSNQVVLVVHSLSQLVNSKTEIFLTHGSGRENCLEPNCIWARVSLEVYTGVYVES
ncbi:unnamed protein product [Prunus armeniaca]